VSRAWRRNWVRLEKRGETRRSENGTAIYIRHSIGCDIGRSVLVFVVLRTHENYLTGGRINARTWRQAKSEETGRFRTRDRGEESLVRV